MKNILILFILSLTTSSSFADLTEARLRISGTYFVYPDNTIQVRYPTLVVSSDYIEYYLFNDVATASNACVILGKQLQRELKYRNHYGTSGGGVKVAKFEPDSMLKYNYALDSGESPDFIESLVCGPK